MKLTISGLPGTGKSDLRKLLAKEYGIPSFSVGDLRREYANKREMTIQELNQLGETDYSTDIDADEYQKEWAAKHKSFILEGRLSHWILRKENPKPISIYLMGDEKILAQRILDANRKTETKAQSLEEQVQLNQSRCKSDVRRYQKIYGLETCYNPRDFDISIDVSNLSQKQTLEKIKEKINPLSQFL